MSAEGWKNDCFEIVYEEKWRAYTGLLTCSAVKTGTPVNAVNLLAAVTETLTTMAAAAAAAVATDVGGNGRQSDSKTY